MLSFIVIICLSIVSYSQSAETPAAQQVYCGETPKNILECLGAPKLLKSELSSQCSQANKNINECELMNCIANKSGWMNGNKLDKAKFSTYFDQFAKENPDWQMAVDHMKSFCLATDLPAQGIYINCPAYDAIVCAFASFIKHGQPSQWSKSSQCEYPRQYAGACPICPSDCFAPAIPYGSCNACRVLPRSP